MADNKEVTLQDLQKSILDLMEQNKKLTANLENANKEITDLKADNDKLIKSNNDYFMRMTSHVNNFNNTNEDNKNNEETKDTLSFEELTNNFFNEE